jgi:hypothetical protein
MITVAERVLYAIDLIETGKFELALEQAAIGIDISSQRFYKKTVSSNKDYKNFLKEYYWAIELMALNGIDLEETFFQNFTVLDSKKVLEKPTLADIIYHSVRCSLIHSTGLPDNLTFNAERKVFCGPNYISLPIEIIWGLLAAVVFATVNACEHSQGDYFLKYESSHFLIRDSWGKEALLREVCSRHVTVRVALHITKFQVIS